ncbi:MAG: EVE domain-containing protein [Betaproteobacteria bacterium]
MPKTANPDLRAKGRSASSTRAPKSSDRTYWIGVVSRSHVEIGVKGGFIQLGHGKKAPLQKLRAGDGLVMYSPRTAYPDGEPLQSFTAIGSITSAEIYQVEMSADFKPYRVDVRFSKCKEAPIKPLIDKLSFVKNKTHWGAAFRFGQLKIPAEDFALIAKAMGASSLARNAL